MKALPTPTVKSLEHLPLVCTVADVCELYGETPSSIERLVREGHGIPAPILRRPMRWSRADLEAHLSGQYSFSSAARKRRAS